MGGYYRFAHIDGPIPSDRAVYARPLQVHRDESCTQGLDRLELIRFLQVAQTISVHHGALGASARRHADPRTTQHDDRARGNLDRHGVHFLTAYVAGI